MASAIHVANPSFDFRKQFALFSVSYRPESGGNPSTSFKLISARLVDNPPPNTSMGVSFAAFRPLVDESDKEKSPVIRASLFVFVSILTHPLQIRTNYA